MNLTHFCFDDKNPNIIFGTGDGNQFLFDLRTN